MSSTNKTVHYELNDWLGTDKPTRSDFTRDNYIIDAALYMHTADIVAHLSREEKARVREPFDISVIQGDDAATRTVTFDFTPIMVIYFAADEPPFTISGGTPVVNACIAVNGGGASASCSLGAAGFTVNHGTSGGVSYNLNDSDCQYVVVAVR